MPLQTKRCAKIRLFFEICKNLLKKTAFSAKRIHFYTQRTPYKNVVEWSGYAGLCACGKNGHSSPCFCSEGARSKERKKEGKERWFFKKEFSFVCIRTRGGCARLRMCEKSSNFAG